MAEHDRKVELIAEQLRTRKSSAPVSLHKRAVSHEVPKARDKRHSDEKIDVSELDAILEIDPIRRICIAEPGVTFVDLVAATLPFGLVPTVVPELETITIGGAVSGCSIESSSFRVGGFHDSCLEYEIITGTGEIIQATKTNENRLVFEMMHGSFGTLGILSKLVFRLAPAKPYVHVANELFSSLTDYVAAIQHYADAPSMDFVDGILHAPDALSLSKGWFVDEAPSTYHDSWREPYYRTTRHHREEYFETPRYFFRYDRGVTNVDLIGSSALLRLGQWLHPFLPAERPKVTLDVFIPISRVLEFMHWYESEIGFFPLWCVPYRISEAYAWANPEHLAITGDKLFVDLAIYGMKQPDGKNIYRMIEEALFRVGGLKTLISHNYYTEDEFWRVWNKPNYEAVKKLVDPNNVFRDVYTKTCRAARGLS